MEDDVEMKGGLTKQEYDRLAQQKSRAKKRAERLAEEALERIQNPKQDRAEETRRITELQWQRESRERLIVAELDGSPLVDEPLDGGQPGETYLQSFWKEVDIFIRELRLGLVPHDDAALWNALSMTEPGRCILRHFGIPAMLDAGWERYEFISQENGKGMIRTVNPLPEVPDLFKQKFGGQR